MVPALEQQLRRLPGWGHGGRARVGWEDPGFVPELAASHWNDAGGQLGAGGDVKPRAAAAVQRGSSGQGPVVRLQALPVPRRAGEASPAAPGRRAAAAPRQRLLRRALIRPSVPSHHPFPWAPEVPKGTAGTT